MLVKHSFSITVSRFSLFYKFLLYLAIVLLIFSAISISSMYFIMKPIIAGVHNMQFFDHLSEAFKSMFLGDLELQQNAFAVLGSDFSKIGEVFATNKNNVIGAVCALIAFMFIGKFIISIGHYPLADVVNNFMNSNSKYGFTANLIAHLKKAVAYSFVDTLIYIPYMLLLGALVYLIIWGVGMFSLLFALSLSVLTVMVLLALKSSVFAMWLPTYINEDLGVFKSLQKAILTNKDLIVKNWGLFTAVNFLSYLVTVLFGLVTFGLGFIMCISLLSIFYLTIRLVIYYRRNERKYYIDAETVIDSKHSIKSVY
ncbi:MAG: hypothetical protein K2P12_04870 [Clostridia bacterium]|nr:hypothetical protein [Clostridia bacterium]